jgi:hypothetical protein
MIDSPPARRKLSSAASRPAAEWARGPGRRRIEDARSPKHVSVDPLLRGALGRETGAKRSNRLLGQRVSLKSQ